MLTLNANDALLGYAIKNCTASMSIYEADKDGKFSKFGNKDLFELYSDNIFKSLDDESLQQLFSETHKRLAKRLEIPACHVVYGKHKTHERSLGVYSRADANITINKEALEEIRNNESLISSKNMGYYYLSIIMHETRHSYHTILVNKMRMNIRLSNAERHVAVYHILDACNRKIGLLDEFHQNVEHNSLVDYKLIPDEFDCRNWTVTEFEKLMEEGEIKTNDSTKKILNKLRVGQINDIDYLKNRGAKKSFDELDSLDYYSQTANLNRFLLIQYSGSNGEFLAKMAEMTDTEKYLDEVKDFYNDELKKLNEYEKEISVPRNKDIERQG